jgi:hypothetical protein
MGKPAKTQITAMVKRELASVNNDRATTVTNVSEAIKSNDALLDQLLSEVVFEAVYAYGRYALDGQRRAITGRSIEMRKRINDLMSFPLLSGLHLGEARKSEILEHAEFCHRLAISNLERSKFLFSVAAKLPSPNAKVKNFLSQEQLEALYVAARGEAMVAA